MSLTYTPSLKRGAPTPRLQQCLWIRVSLNYTVSYHLQFWCTKLWMSFPMSLLSVQVHLWPPDTSVAQHSNHLSQYLTSPQYVSRSRARSTHRTASGQLQSPLDISTTTPPRITTHCIPCPIQYVCKFTLIACWQQACMPDNPPPQQWYHVVTPTGCFTLTQTHVCIRRHLHTARMNSMCEIVVVVVELVVVVVVLLFQLYIIVEFVGSVCSLFWMLGVNLQFRTWVPFGKTKPS